MTDVDESWRLLAKKLVAKPVEQFMRAAHEASPKPKPRRPASQRKAARLSLGRHG